MKRNEFSYESAGVVSEMETQELLREVREFESITEVWIRDRHPGLA